MKHIINAGFLRSRLVLSLLITLMGIVGCSDKSNDIVGAGAELWNYTDEDVYLTLRSPGDPNVGTYLETAKHAGGGKLMCCVALPRKWRPGLKVQVDYTYGNPPNDRKHSKVLELPPYPDGVAGPVYISVFSEHEVEVISSIYGPRAPGWPGKKNHLP